MWVTIVLKRNLNQIPKAELTAAIIVCVFGHWNMIWLYHVYTHAYGSILIVKNLPFY